MKFKDGDKVRIINNYNFSSIPIGSIGRVVSCDGFYCSIMVEGQGDIWHAFQYSQLELLKDMNIKEKFILALTSEPKKSFRKAGITDGDDILTEEGSKIFLTWLLHTKFSEDFKKDVVESLVDEKKDKEEKGI